MFLTLNWFLSQTCKTSAELLVSLMTFGLMHVDRNIFDLVFLNYSECTKNAGLCAIVLSVSYA